MAIQVDTNVKTESQAVRSMADLIKNPPQNPVEMVRWVAKNFTITGDVIGSVGKALGLGKALPMIGEIFNVFASFTAPSVGEQIAQAVQQITSAIQAGVEEIKNALTFSTEKTISAVITEVQNISMEESAARVVQAMVESEILAEADTAMTEMFDDYTEKVKAMNEQWHAEITDALNEANAQVQAQYEKIQEILAALGIDMVKELYDLYLRATAAQEAAPAVESRALPGAQASTTVAAASSGGSSNMLLLAGGAAVLVFFLMRKKN